MPLASSAASAISATSWLRPRGEQRAQQQVVGALAIALAFDRELGAADRVVDPVARVVDPALREHHLGQLRLQRDRALARPLGAIDPLPLAVVEVIVVGAHVGDRGVRQREARILRDRALEHLQRELRVVARQPPPVALAAQVEVVGLQVLGRLGGERLLLLGRQRDAQRLRDLARDLVLDLEHVLHLAVVTLRPQREVGLRVHQLGVDAQPRAGAAQAAGEHAGRLELLADLRRRHLLVAIGEHGGTREDVQPADLRELGDDVLGDPVAQVLVLLHPAQVLEVEHRDRLLRRLARARAGIARLRRAASARLHVALEPHQVGLELGRGLVAHGAILLERLLEDARERRRERRVHLVDRGRLAIEDRLVDHRRGLAFERQHAGRHLVEHRAEREQVGARVGELSARLLGRHVGDRAERGAREGEIVARRHRLELRGRRRDRPPLPAHLREAEVEDLRLPARRHPQVGRLDVAMHDALGVRRLERVRDLDRDGEDLVHRHRPPSHHLGQGLAVEQLHHDEVLLLVLLDRVDRADAGVVERRGGARLALEPLERARVPRHLGAQELERHAPPELRVLGLVDDAHAAAAELADDGVVANGVAGEGFHGGEDARRRDGARSNASPLAAIGSYRRSLGAGGGAGDGALSAVTTGYPRRCQSRYPSSSTYACSTPRFFSSSTMMPERWCGQAQ